ncbi:hypothetical protein PHISP_01867 [Aspergillus sp. HF37]|nr:hypothetical protein PHISP_01867 [Aspergillus sp. HF37]
MSAKPPAGPSNAWDDDDWESQADKLAGDPTPPSEKKVSSKVTKAQRRAQQAEFNRQLWAEAEQPETFHFLEAKSDVPLKQEYKPAVTLLSRKPQVASRSSDSTALESATARIGQLGLTPEDDSDDSENKPPEPTPEERQAMALRNREEKQRKYEEVRERLFGSPSAPTSGSSSPRSSTPPKEARGKGKSRGSGRDNKNKRDSSAASGKSKQLYDPGQSPKPSPAYLQRDERQFEEQHQTRQVFLNTRGHDNWRGTLRQGPSGAGAF